MDDIDLQYSSGSLERSERIEQGKQSRCHTQSRQTFAQVINHQIELFKTSIVHKLHVKW